MNSPFFKSSKNQLAPDTSLDPDENAPTLKMGERPDWSLFRSIDGLQQKAGVPATRLRRLVMKEIADNALDTGTGIDAGQIDDHVIYVAENGPGIDGTPEEIAELFSISRPMLSTKLLRLPQRGALGNGLRVVAGAVLASEGSLVVITRNRRIVLRPEADGTTAVVEVTAVDHPGRHPRRDRLRSGPAARHQTRSHGRAAARQIALERQDLRRQVVALVVRRRGLPRAASRACGTQPVRSLIAQLDGCTGGKAGEIVAAAGLARMACEQRHPASRPLRLLAAAREHARPVKSEPPRRRRPRRVSPDAAYAITRGTRSIGSGRRRRKSRSSSRRGPRKTDETGRHRGLTRLRATARRSPVDDQRT